jgi:2-amino-4-hydroxy-6-hydroxymethyldihydropteridine diphosphokinase
MKPRTIDIDIVFFDNEKINTSKLKIPHYDWQNRDFFIKPLKEINCQAEEFKNFGFA